MQDLKVSIVQSDIAWEDPASNLIEFEKKIDSLGGTTDLIILPEMFSTGFTMNAPPLAEKPNGKSVEWMQKMAQKRNAVIIGSLVIAEKGRYLNRLFCVFSDGKIQSYDKRHLFRMADEHNIYSAGNSQLVVKVKDWRIAPFVCYDLRFPVWSRNVKQAYDALVFVANWPARRASHWKILLKARAIENQAFCIGVNRVGTDGLGVSYKGSSAIIDPLGNEVIAAADGENVQTGRLSVTKLTRFREKFPAWMDSDSFKIDE